MHAVCLEHLRVPFDFFWVSNFSMQGWVADYFVQIVAVTKLPIFLSNLNPINFSVAEFRCLWKQGEGITATVYYQATSLLLFVIIFVKMSVLLIFCYSACWLQAIDWQVKGLHTFWPTAGSERY